MFSWDFLSYKAMAKSPPFLILFALFVSSNAETIIFEAEELCEPAQQSGTVLYSEVGDANQYLDKVFSDLGPFIDQHQLDPLALPDVETKFSKKITFIRVSGGFKGTNLRLRGLKTLHRAGNAIVRHDGNTLKIQVTIGIKNMQLSGNGQAWLGKIKLRPSLSASIDYVAATAHLEVPMIEGQKPRATLFQINTIGKIKVKVGKLGPLNWILGPVGTLVVNNMKNNLKGKIEAPMLTTINKALGKFPGIG